jgi:hypothetical protein
MRDEFTQNPTSTTEKARVVVSLCESPRYQEQKQ